jgi:AmmeMemoRadiSam system radical SAM enzyme/AmmeMemoRadiSam system protein B/AmmeMemoRadiSam system protein A
MNMTELLKKILAFLFLAVVLGATIFFIYRRENAVHANALPGQAASHEANYYEPLSGKKVRCFLCPNQCVMAPSQWGACKARKNINGKLFSMVYGKIAAAHVDPIEKKPFFHVLPGSTAFSIATTGCNMRCLFCQNWEISQAFPEDVPAQAATPEDVVAQALASGTRAIAFTYGEPVIAYEYMLDIAKLAKTKGLKTVVVSNGYIEEAPLKELLKYIDAYKVDLKAFHQDFYRKYTGGRLETVLENLKIIKQSGVWLEIVTLLVPGENDGDDQLRAMARWIRSNLGDSVPLHFSRFFPQFKLKNLPPTPPETLIRARKIAMEEGLKFVYTGNTAFPEGETTWCPGSKEKAIVRQSYFVTANNLKDGACPDGEKSPAFGNSYLQYMPAMYLTGLAIVSLAFTFTLPWEKEKNKEEHVRKAAVAGTFYPGDKAALEEYVDTLLRQAPPPEIKEPIRAIMVPHAGYVYSGLVAAYAYKELEGRDVRTVILMCNSHRHFLDGIAVYGKGSFETPLGRVPIDEEKTVKLLAASPKIMDRPDIHEGDHVLEVQLPFLQRVLKNFKIVPLLFGSDDPVLSKILADALKTIADDKTLLVASTDMSHYPSYENATTADRETLQAIQTGQADALDAMLKQHASAKVPNAETFLCGVSGVRTVLLLTQTLGPTTPVYLKYANSGDAAGDKSRVVGYGAVAFVAKQSAMHTAPPPPADKEKSRAAEEQSMTPHEKEELLKIARSTVESYVRTGKVPTFSPASPALVRPHGTFVTLKENGRLRGCIGRFDPSGPLYLIVQQMAISAASQDPRFKPVNANELGNLEYEISVLSPLRKIKTADEIELGKHGVQVSKGFHHGVFLPQVAAETGWSKKEFLDELCSQKAGLPRDCWKDPSVNLEVFTADVFSEEKKQS